MTSTILYYVRVEKYRLLLPLCNCLPFNSLYRIVEYARIIPCLLDPLNKIWTLVGWKDNYVSSVSQLFSDGQFLKLAYHVVKFSEEQLKRSKTEGSGARDLSLVALLKLILPLLLQVNVHLNLWSQTMAIKYTMYSKLHLAMCL